MNHKLFILNHVILTLKTYLDINSLRLFYTKLNNKHLIHAQRVKLAKTFFLQIQNLNLKLVSFANSPLLNQSGKVRC